MGFAKLGLRFFAAVLMVHQVLSRENPINSPPLDPYPQIHGGQRTGQIPPGSPDPYGNYAWNLDALPERFAYQSYSDFPVHIVGDPTEKDGFLNLDSLTSSNGSALIKSTGFITAKFQQEGACWIEFDSAALAESGATVVMSVSEGAIPGEVYDIVPTQHGNTYRLETNNQLYEGIFYTFINVTHAGTKPWTLANLRRICQVVPTNYEGSFTSSNTLLNRIWYTGAYTIKITQVGKGLFSEGGYLGSELKDRGDRIAFLGDAYATQGSALYAFGNYDMLARSINYTKDISNTIQPYWIMWVMSVLDFHDFTGDNETLQMLRPWVERRLDTAFTIAQSAGATPLVWSRDDERMGFGFESPNRPEAVRAFNALLVGAARRYSHVCSTVFENKTAAARYAFVADAVTKMVHAADTPWYARFGMHASADAINAGLASAADAAAMLDGVFSDPLQLPSLSNFGSYFLLQALGKINATTQALYLVQRHWGPMLALGATTTWERFDPQWADSGCLPHEFPPVNAMNDDTSMAHPWASGATAYLSKYGLGIRPTVPGFRRWELVPMLVDDGQHHFLQGAVPTPHGTIELEINVTRGSMRVTVPSRTVAQRIGFPTLGRGLRSVVCATPAAALRVYRNDTQHNSRFTDHTPGAHGTGLSHDGVHLFLHDVLPGQYEYLLEWELPTANDTRAQTSRETNKWDPNNTAFDFKAALVGVDKTTGGDWHGTYGSKGHVLFGYDVDTGAPITALPPFIAGVYAASNPPNAGGPPFPNPNTSTCTPKHHVYACATPGVPTNDSRALAPPTGAGSERVMSAVTSQRWASFHIDVVVAPTPTLAPTFNISFYMVDFDNAFIRQSLKDFSHGAYVTYTYNQSMFVRFLQVPSAAGLLQGFPPRPVVSGVFFD